MVTNSPIMACDGVLRVFRLAAAAGIAVACLAQSQPGTSAVEADAQINVNWFYGSYVPKDVPLVPLDGRERFKLYLRQTYTTPGIYVKTTLFALRDQIHGTNPEWGDGFAGFAKRLGTRQASFFIQNSLLSLGDGLLGWEPRYDRCRCTGFWPRTRHAIKRNFVTYDRTEKALRPQIMPYVGAFAGAGVASAWQPGPPKWQIEGYQAAVTQIFIGSGINWISEFAPELTRVLSRKRKPVQHLKQ